MKINLRVLALIFLLGISLISCSKKGHWIKTKEELKLFIKEDSGTVFSWKGGEYEGLVHGSGTLTLTRKDGTVEHKEYKAFYGGVEEDDIRTTDKGRYVGLLHYDLMSGFGVFMFKDGEHYIGDFTNGTMDGEGTLYLKNNVRITAKWEGTNKLPKKARIYFANGDVYEGKFINGLPSPNGKWMTAMEYVSEGIKMSSKTSLVRANEFYEKHKEELEDIAEKDLKIESVDFYRGKNSAKIIDEINDKIKQAMADIIAKAWG